MELSNMGLLAYMPPLLMMGAALSAAVLRDPKPVFQIGRAMTAVSVIITLIAGGLIYGMGPVTSPLLGIGQVGFSARLDALSVIIMWLVALLSLFIVQFSHNYLDGDERHAVFLGRLYLTIGAVLVFVGAGNVWQLLLGWVGTSLSLHQLLIFYNERPRAIRAARKKFIVARLGDLCLLSAIILLVGAFDTTDIVALGEATQAAMEGGPIPIGATVAAVLVVIAASLKSAVFPFHGWLLEVMETPTPGSALLHAGLLNAGIYLVVRFGPLVFLSTPALVLLILVGGFTALFASTVMITQTSVKVSLAYSSAAHMGFMLMLCGFGAHSVAIMHLVAHSFYKAHAFLSSGSFVEYVQHTGSQKLNKAPKPLSVFVNISLALAMFVTIGSLLGIELTKRPGETALGAIFAMAVAHLLIKGTSDHAPLYVISRTEFAAAAVTLAFFALELTAAPLLGNSVAVLPQPNPFTLGIMVMAVLAFAAVTLLGSVLPALAGRPAWRALYVHLKNGLYANALFDRLIRSS
ncbi:MAG: proton-conducting transporter membrane subunit [Anaerolineae bacterium]